jgi:hypothetical protein
MIEVALNRLPLRSPAVPPDTMNMPYAAFMKTPQINVDSLNLRYLKKIKNRIGFQITSLQLTKQDTSGQSKSDDAKVK